MFSSLLHQAQSGDFRALARCISMIEHEPEACLPFLEQLPAERNTVILGITGPPGAGKSTLADALIGTFLKEQKKIAVLAVDPRSPFHKGALLGDRIRMSRHFTDPHVFIRSLSNAGMLGGLHPDIIAISDVVASCGFDLLIIETVGVGQNEVEIAGLADTTLVVLVPESGDEVQTMKSGLMDIADIFVVNKADHDFADVFARSLRQMSHPKDSRQEIPLVKTIATSGDGIDELVKQIQLHQERDEKNMERKAHLIANKAFQLIAARRMQGIRSEDLQKEIRELLKTGSFNLYQFIRQF